VLQQLVGFPCWERVSYVKKVIGGIFDIKTTDLAELNYAAVHGFDSCQRLDVHSL